MSRVIGNVLEGLRARQKELAPLVQEYTQVESAINALERVDGIGKVPQARGA